jgi:hypothetical protein
MTCFQENETTRTQDHVHPFLCIHKKKTWRPITTTKSSSSFSSSPSSFPFSKWLILAIHLLLLSHHHHQVNGSNINNNNNRPNNNKYYHIYNYDQTSQQFTPDGRLIQVEYASHAVEHSSPVVIVECNVNDDATTETTKSLSSSYSAYPCLIVMTIPQLQQQRLYKSPQQRIVILNNNYNNVKEYNVKEYNDNYGGTVTAKTTTTTTSSSSSPYVVIMSGILADSLALLQSALMEESKHQLECHASFTMQQMARSIAQTCHARTQKGGLRPYGSTIVLCGYHQDDDHEYDFNVNNDNNNNSDESDDKKRDLSGGDGMRDGWYKSLILQTDPSGAILQHNVNHRKVTKSDQDTSITCSSHVRCIVGGTPTLQQQLQKRLQQDLPKLDFQKSTPPPTLSERIAYIAKILYQETAIIKNSNKNKKDATISTKASSINESETPIVVPSEVVVISPRLGGCHRLDEQQLERIRKLMLQG